MSVCEDADVWRCISLVCEYALCLSVMMLSTCQCRFMMLLCEDAEYKLYRCSVLVCEDAYYLSVKIFSAVCEDAYHTHTQDEFMSLYNQNFSSSCVLSQPTSK